MLDSTVAIVPSMRTLDELLATSIERPKGRQARRAWRQEAESEIADEALLPVETPVLGVRYRSARTRFETTNENADFAQAHRLLVEIMRRARLGAEDAVVTVESLRRG